MSLFSPNLEKACKALESSVSRHAMAVADREAHRLAPADPGDFSARKKWVEQDEALTRDIGIAADVVDHWRAVVANLEEEAAKKAKEAERTAVEKEASGPMADLVRKIATKQAELAEMIVKLEEHRDRADAARVEDAEIRVRRGPPQTRAAITETVVAWFDKDGNRYGSDEVYDERHQCWVRAPDRVQREVVDVIFDESTTPGHMPTRFADAIRLVDLGGRSLWPR